MGMCDVQVAATRNLYKFSTLSKRQPSHRLVAQFSSTVGFVTFQGLALCRHSVADLRIYMCRVCACALNA